MEARAAAAEARVVTLTAASTQLRATAADLRLFVDVLQSVAPESRPLAELKASEARHIRDLQVGLRRINMDRVWLLMLYTGARLLQPVPIPGQCKGMGGVEGRRRVGVLTQNCLQNFVNSVSIGCMSYLASSKYERCDLVLPECSMHTFPN